MFTEKMKQEIMTLGKEAGHDLSPLFEESTSEEDKQALALVALVLESKKDLSEGRSMTAEDYLEKRREKRVDN